MSWPEKQHVWHFMGKCFEISKQLSYKWTFETKTMVFGKGGLPRCYLTALHTEVPRCVLSNCALFFCSVLNHYLFIFAASFQKNLFDTPLKWQKTASGSTWKSCQLSCYSTRKGNLKKSYKVIGVSFLWVFKLRSNNCN